MSQRIAFPIAALLAAALFGQEKTAKPADPISDRLRFEIASAQRDYVLAKQQLDQVAATLKTKAEEAQKLCGAQGRRFDAATFACVETK